MKLPDILAPNLKVVFVGTAVGNRSSAVGRYYAGRGNKFWPILHELKLVPELRPYFNPGELLALGIGLTDLAKHTQGADRSLRSEDFDIQGFLAKMDTFQPGIIALNGKRAYQILTRSKKFAYGPQPNWTNKHRVHVLPSTSGAANRYWDEKPWRDLARILT